MASRRATPSGHTSARGASLAHPDIEAGCFGWPLAWALLWALLLGALLGGCATDPLLALDRAERMGLVRWQAERPFARISDAAPWGHTRRVEIDR